jgi:hypothetical protein
MVARERFPRSQKTDARHPGSAEKWCGMEKSFHGFVSTESTLAYSVRLRRRAV